MDIKIKEIYSQVYGILEMLGNDYITKLPSSLYTMINDERLKEYNPHYDLNMALEQQDIKKEFAFNRKFESFEELETELFDYVNWYNNFRIHSSINYLTPVEYKKVSL